MFLNPVSDSFQRRKHQKPDNNQDTHVHVNTLSVCRLHTALHSVFYFLLHNVVKSFT